jgi:hypothetical protein
VQPPDTVRLIVPFAPPLQLTLAPQLNCDKTPLEARMAGCVSVNDAVVLQPFWSVTVTM